MGGKNNLVLVVDDDAEWADQMKFMLELLEFEVLTASDPTSSFDLAEAKRPQIVLVSLSLAGTESQILLERIRKESWGQEMKILAHSGYLENVEVEHLVASGYDGHLMKPINMGILQGTLTELCA